MMLDLIKKLAVIGMAVLLSGCNAVDMDKFVDELYDRMSQDERIAQLRSGYMDDLFDENGQLDTEKCKELIPYGIGHFSQYASQKPMDPNVLRDRVAAVQDWLMNNTPNGIPALYHEEVLSGVNTQGSTVYPQQIGQACSFNPELAELKTLQTGTVMRKMGGVLSLSPMVDVCRVPSFNRLEESYGEDAYLSAVMGNAFARGLQQGDLRKGVATEEPYNIWDNRIEYEWMPWDMSSLGEVDKVVFTMDCSEKNADGSLHIAPYFCIDGIRLK